MENIPTLKAQWNTIIEQKLKAGQSLDDLIVHYEDGITMTPNIVSEEIAHIDHKLETSADWVNMAYISHNSDVEMNRLIHLALNQGANGLIFNVDDTNDIQKVLNGVMTEYLQIIVRSEKMIEANSPNISVVNSMSTQVIDLPQKDKIIAFRSLRNELSNNKPIQISISVGKNLLFEIAFIRAIRIYFQNHQKCDFQIFGKFEVEGTNELGDYDLIEKTYKTISIILGGADAVVTDYKGDESSRLTLNIQNILDLESSFKKVIDPTSGAYYIELLTDKILSRLKS